MKPGNLLVTTTTTTSPNHCANEYTGIYNNTNNTNTDTNSTSSSTTLHHLVLIDFGSAADYETMGLFQSNIGFNPHYETISPIYAAPELSTNQWNKHSSNALAYTVDGCAVALLYCQILFQLLEERTIAAFHQQLQDAQWDLDVWLYNMIQSKVRTICLQEAILVLAQRPGLWSIVRSMLYKDPNQRISSATALQMWRTVVKQAKEKERNHSSSSSSTVHNNSNSNDTESLQVKDGPYFWEVVESLQFCPIDDVVVDEEEKEENTTSSNNNRMTSTTKPTTSIRPLEFVATFDRRKPLGLYLSESDAETSTTLESKDLESTKEWDMAVIDAKPGEVFVQGITPDSQADEMGIFAIGDQLQGIGELPFVNGGFVKALAMLQDQPISAKYVTLHFGRRQSISNSKKNSILFHHNQTVLSSGTTTTVGTDPTTVSMNRIYVADQGAWSMTGRRQAQEDTFLLHEVHSDDNQSLLVAGVMDGHLGSAASKFVQNEFPQTISSVWHKEQELWKSSFLEQNNYNANNNDTTSTTTSSLQLLQPVLEESWNMVCDAYRWRCSTEEECVAEYDSIQGTLLAHTGGQSAVAGTTFCCFVLNLSTSAKHSNEQIVSLNCGDSRGVVLDGESGTLYYQTSDHTPQSEFLRLQHGASIGLDYSIPECQFGSRWVLRVGDYDYAVARSLEGSLATSKGIVSDIDYTVLSAKAGMILVLASDGLWEVIDTEEVCQYIRKRKTDASASDVAKELCYRAYDKGSTDNISCVVLYLDSL